MLVVNQEITFAVNTDCIESLKVKHLIGTMYNEKTGEYDQFDDGWGIVILRFGRDEDEILVSYETKEKAEGEFMDLMLSVSANKNVHFF